MCKDLLCYIVIVAHVDSVALVTFVVGFVVSVTLVVVLVTIGDLNLGTNVDLACSFHSYCAHRNSGSVCSQNIVGLVGGNYFDYFCSKSHIHTMDFVDRHVSFVGL